MVGQEQGVIMRDVRFESDAEVRRPGSGIAHQRDAAETHDDFREASEVQRAPRNGKASGGGRGRGTNGNQVRAHAIKKEVPGPLPKKTAIAREPGGPPGGGGQSPRGHHTLIPSPWGG